MDWERLNKDIEDNKLYKFMVRHKKIINIIQGIFIILLLIAVNRYVVRDYFIKEQIRDNCGYVDSTFKCVCEKHYVDDWESLKGLQHFDLNVSLVNNSLEK